MKRLIPAFGFLAVIMCMGASVAGATPLTILTFRDPGTTAFTFTADGDPLVPGGSLIGFNSDIEVEILNGPLAGGVYSDAMFTLTDTLGGVLDVIDTSYYPVSLELESGILEIYDTSSGMDLLLGVTFDFATLTRLEVGATDLALANVSFYGPATVNFGSPETFSFALTAMNPPDAFDQDDLPDWTANAAFTSSAQEIPEPVSLIAVLAGGLGMLSVPRKRR